MQMWSACWLVKMLWPKKTTKTSPYAHETLAGAMTILHIYTVMWLFGTNSDFHHSQTPCLTSENNPTLCLLCLFCFYAAKHLTGERKVEALLVDSWSIVVFLSCFLWFVFQKHLSIECTFLVCIFKCTGLKCDSYLHIYLVTLILRNFPLLSVSYFHTSSFRWTGEYWKPQSV